MRYVTYEVERKYSGWRLRTYNIQTHPKLVYVLHNEHELNINTCWCTSNDQLYVSHWRGFPHFDTDIDGVGQLTDARRETQLLLKL